MSIDDAEDRIEIVVDQYIEHMNPGLASLMKFGGFGDVEFEGEGCYLRTVGGAEYLDCLCSYGVFALGHRHPRVVEAVRQQLDLLPLSSRTFFNEQAAALAARLAELAPGELKYTFFSNSGTEAVEAALKMARAATGKTDFVSTHNAYHGKTMGALSATGREVFRSPFQPLVPGFTHVPFGDANAIAAAISPTTAAVIVEPVQGEGGIICPSDDYLPAVRRVCDDQGVLLIFDEVQTGIGRCGKMFAAEHWGVAPDIMTLAKALGGGVMPIGATMGTPAVWNAVFGINPLLHTSTFGGNPMACAAGLAAIDALTSDGLLEACIARGDQFLSGLRDVQRRFPAVIRDVRGIGLMIGVEFVVKDVAELTINGMARRGVIAAYTLNNPNVIRIEPPLIITSDQVVQALMAIGEAVEESIAMLEGL